ncbi:MAG: hypothetical protein JXA10_10875 [Anaerolineae bacterium]|nr:hypothetical protein [Anaerolineae bacterium]
MIETLACPNCGKPLPKTTQEEQLVKCAACQATILVSGWQTSIIGDEVVVQTPTRIYILRDLITKDDLCNVYRCTFRQAGQARQGLFRLARHVADNDLVTNEAQTLYFFQQCADYDDFQPLVPRILESFAYQDATIPQARQVNIVSMDEQITAPDEFYTLEEVKRTYGAGIHPKDMAWMWRRLLNVLGFAHDNGVIHGAVLPPYIWIEPKGHRVMLMGWGFSVRVPNGEPEKMKALSVPYEEWYPPSVKQPAKAALDIGLAVRTMLYLMAIDPLAKRENELDLPSLPQALKSYFWRCLSTEKTAWLLLQEFDQIIESCWGPREFRVFTMPDRTG